jgi:pimeloyl-ACP methyl ester carboxylesterase
VKDHYVTNGGVRIHYVTVGSGPVVLFVHGFPNWWYDWREQMDALRGSYTCVALDTRGYNLSDKPQEVDAFKMETLVSDVNAVVGDLGVEDVTLIAHDWGAGISWRYAMTHPERVNKLVIINLTHPKGYMAVRQKGTPEQKAAMEYIRRIQDPDAHKAMTPQMLTARIQDEVIKARYVKAYENSSFNSMFNYYRARWPQLESGEEPEVPNLSMPVLQIHGLADRAVDKDGLRDTWNWIDEDYTLLTLPGVGHDPHHDAADLVNGTILWWMKSRE